MCRMIRCANCRTRVKRQIAEYLSICESATSSISLVVLHKYITFPTNQQESAPSSLVIELAMVCYSDLSLETLGKGNGPPIPVGTGLVLVVEQGGVIIFAKGNLAMPPPIDTRFSSSHMKPLHLYLGVQQHSSRTKTMRGQRIRLCLPMMVPVLVYIRRCLEASRCPDF